MDGCSGTFNATRFRGLNDQPSFFANFLDGPRADCIGGHIIHTGLGVYDPGTAISLGLIRQLLENLVRRLRTFLARA